MSTYYVATLAHYVLVDASTEDEARELARPLLQELRAKAAPPGAEPSPVQIRTVRPATDDEMELMQFDARMQRDG
jgi:hypothetical protein